MMLQCNGMYNGNDNGMSSFGHDPSLGSSTSLVSFNCETHALGILYCVACCGERQWVWLRLSDINNARYMVLVATKLTCFRFKPYSTVVSLNSEVWKIIGSAKQNLKVFPKFFISPCLPSFQQGTRRTAFEVATLHILQGYSAEVKVH